MGVTKDPAKLETFEEYQAKGGPISREDWEIARRRYLVDLAFNIGPNEMFPSEKEEP